MDSQGFSRFSELPAELRACIWEHALHNEEGKLHGRPRVIELHSLDYAVSAISVTISRKYPRLFAVNREARYEVAKLLGGEWVRMHVGYKGCTGSRGSQLDVYISFSRDILFLSERFMEIDSDKLWEDCRRTPEEARLRMLSGMISTQDLWKLRHIFLSTCRPREERRLDLRAWWVGEGLDLFNGGALESVSLLTSSENVGAYAVRILMDLFYEAYKEEKKKPIPEVGLRAFQYGRETFHGETDRLDEVCSDLGSGSCCTWFDTNGLYWHKKTTGD